MDEIVPGLALGFAGREGLGDQPPNCAGADRQRRRRRCM